jgi:hypothetical protein
MITLRDHFAAAALTGLLAAGTRETTYFREDFGLIDAYADLAYAFAAAMLLRSHNAPHQSRVEAAQ